MAGRGLRRLGLLVLAIAIVAGAGFLGARFFADRFATGPEPATIAEASLQGLREQNRLSAFVASYVAVVTARQSRFGLSAEKTLILPGLVRYEVDLARLRPADVRWDAPSAELRVVLPPVEVVGPEIDLTRIREYSGGGLLLRLTDTEAKLDAANRRAGQAELLRQARLPAPMKMARDATRRAIESSFALPLRAAGVQATVRVRFPDEPNFPPLNDEQMDRTRSLKEVFEN